MFELFLCHVHITVRPFCDCCCSIQEKKLSLKICDKFPDVPKCPCSQLRSTDATRFEVVTDKTERIEFELKNKPLPVQSYRHTDKQTACFFVSSIQLHNEKDHEGLMENTKHERGFRAGYCGAYGHLEEAICLLPRGTL